MINETWKPIAGFEGRYEVSDLGRVRSLDRVGERNGRPARFKGRVLKPGLDGDGYQHVSLGAGNIRKIHRLVAQAFKPNPDNLPEVDHEDTDKLNCGAANLRWCTTQQNAAYRHEKTQKTCVRKVTAEVEALVSALIAGGKPIVHVAKQFGISRSHARRLALPKEVKDCGHCGAVFSRQAGAGQSYCSRKCAKAEQPRTMLGQFTKTE